MGEYFCPHCGAIFNDQEGFGPDCGVWRCTECGKMSMDEDVYEGDAFQGVAWFCDECGELLNRQDGFSDTYGTWTCTECGFENGITEDDIVKYYCPHCGAILDKQSSFSEYDYDYTCSECESRLYRECCSDDFKKAKYICPNCDGVLDEQSSFSEYVDDWECRECGSKLHKDSMSEEFVVEEDDQEGECEEECDCPNCGANLKEQFDFYGDDYYVCEECGAELYKDLFGDYEIVDDDDDCIDERDCDEDVVEDETEQCDEEEIFDDEEECSILNKIKKIFLRTIYTIVTIALLVLLGMYEVSLITPVGYNSSDFIGQDLNEVYKMLQREGFSFINVKEVADLSITELDKDNKVTEVKVGFNKFFDKNTKYPSNFPIKITYHSLAYAYPPISSKNLEKYNVEEVENMFEKEGFVNIKTSVQYDVVLGWFTKEGEIESITINGDEKFDEDSEYKIDSEIVITYHDLKKNKSK